MPLKTQPRHQALPEGWSKPTPVYPGDGFADDLAEVWEAFETECRALEVEAQLATFSRGFAVDWGGWMR